MAGEGEDRIVVAVAPAPDKGKPVVSMLESIRDTANSANSAIAQLQKTIGQTGAAATIKQTLAQATAGATEVEKTRKKSVKGVADAEAASARAAVAAEIAAAKERGGVRDRLFLEGERQRKEALAAAKAGSKAAADSATQVLTKEQQINKVYADRAGLARKAAEIARAPMDRAAQVDSAFQTDYAKALQQRKAQEAAERASAKAALQLEERQFAADLRAAERWGKEWERQAANVAKARAAVPAQAAKAEAAATKAFLAWGAGWGKEIKAVLAQREAAARAADALETKATRAFLAWGAGWGKEIKRVTAERLNAAKAIELAETRAANKAAQAARSQQINRRFQAGPALALGGTLGTAFLGVAALKSLVDQTDAYQQLSNRVRLVTESERERIAVEKELVALSNRSRVSLEANSSVFQRLTTSAGGLGLTMGDLLRVTETISKAAIVGGSTAIEAEKGILQLTQGFSRGALRGDELRSVLEQLPGVADVLANKFETTRGGLFKLGEEGKITGKKMIEAFQESEKEINEKFGRTVPTIGQAFVVLRNNIVAFIGDIQSSTGVFGGIAQSLIGLSNNLETLGRTLATAAIAKSIGLIGAALKGLLLLSPAKIFTLFLSAGLAFSGDLTTVIDGVGKFIEKIKEAKTELDKYVPSARTVKIAIMDAFDSPLVQGFIDKLNEIPDAFRRIKEAMPRPRFGAVGGMFGLDIAAGAAADFTEQGAAAAAAAAARRARNQPPFDPRLASGAAQARFRAAAAFSGLDPLSSEKALTSDNKLFTEELVLGRIVEGRGAGEDTRGQKTGAGAGGQRRTFADFLREAQDQIEVLREQGREHSVIAGIMRVRRALWRDETKMTYDQEMQLRAVLETQQQIREETAFSEFALQAGQDQRLAGLVGDDRQALQDVLSVAQSANVTEDELRASGIAEYVEQLSRATSEEVRYFEILRQIKPAQEEYAQNLATINQLYAEGQINLIQFTQASNDLAIRQLKSSGEFKDGLKAGFLELESQFANLSEAGSGLIVGTFNRATDALLEFTRTGKFEFTNFITEILTQIARLTLEQSVIAPLAKALGGALFGTGTSFFTPNAATPGLDPTINNPGFDPTQLSLGGAGAASRSNNQGTQVYVENVNMAQGTRSEVNQSTGPNGEEFITILTRAVQEKDAEEFQYRMPPHLRQLGLTRQGVHR